MKIVHLIPGLYLGGSERVMETIALSQIKDGDQVTIVSFQQTEFSNRFPGLNVRYCSVNYRNALLRTPDIQTEQYETLIDTIQPDVIHSHAYWTDLISHHNLRPTILYISHFHLCYDEFENVRMFPVTKRTLTRWLDKRRLLAKYRRENCLFIAASESIFEFYRTRMPAALVDKMKVIPNPVDDAFFALHPLPTRYELLTIGRLEEIKNHRFLLQVVSALRQRGIQVRLAVIGEGSLRQELVSYAEELKITPAVSFPGILRGQELFEVFSSSSIYVHAAHDETFGLALFEALAAGLPVVARASDSIRQNLRQVDNLTLIERDDIAAFEQTIEQLLSATDLTRSRVAATRELLRSFAASKYKKTLKEFYAHHTLRD